MTSSCVCNISALSSNSRAIGLVRYKPLMSRQNTPLLWSRVGAICKIATRSAIVNFHNDQGVIENVLPELLQPAIAIHGYRSAASNISFCFG